MCDSLAARDEWYKTLQGTISEHIQQKNRISQANGLMINKMEWEENNQDIVPHSPSPSNPKISSGSPSAKNQENKVSVSLNPSCVQPDLSPGLSMEEDRARKYSAGDPSTSVSGKLKEHLASELELENHIKVVLKPNQEFKKPPPPAKVVGFTEETNERSSAYQVEIPKRPLMPKITVINRSSSLIGKVS